MADPVHCMCVTGAPWPAQATKPERRRLASNVICLFQKDRPPVVNPRYVRLHRRRDIVNLGAWPRIRPGVICEIFGGLPENDGKLMRAVEKDYEGDWRVHALGQPIVYFDSVTRQRTGEEGVDARVPQHRLRRVWSG